MEEAEPVVPVDRIAEREAEATYQPFGVNIKIIGLVAFAFGVLLHGCVAMALLDDGGNGMAEAPAPTEAPDQEATATPVPDEDEGTEDEDDGTADRDDCDEIRGTAYRSDEEREFFLENCLTGMMPPGVPGSPSARDPPPA